MIYFGSVFKLSKLEKQQQRKEKTRRKGNSESNTDRGALHSNVDPSASSGAEGELSSKKGELETFGPYSSDSNAKFFI